MVRDVRVVALHVAICVMVGMLVTAAPAGTIIKLSLGGDAVPDIEFNGGVLSTIDDLMAGTTGEQNTAADFQDFLSGIPEILTSTASVTLDGVTASGPPTVFPSPSTLVNQNFSGGTVSLYDAANTLLLSGSLNGSTLSGTLGAPGMGALFTTTFSMVTGGTLAPQILPNSLTLSMSFSDVNGGAGLSVDLIGPVLNPFTADAALNITGELIPEPAAAILLVLATALGAVGFRPRRRYNRSSVSIQRPNSSRLAADNWPSSSAVACAVTG